MGDVENSVIFEGVIIEEGAVVRDSVIFPCAKIKKGAVVNKSMIGSSAFIGENAEIGSESAEAVEAYYNTKICSDGITLIAPEIVIEDGVKITACSMVTASVKADGAKKPAAGTATA